MSASYLDADKVAMGAATMCLHRLTTLAWGKVR